MSVSPFLRKAVRPSFETLEDRSVPAASIAPVDPILATQIKQAIRSQTQSTLSLAGGFSAESIRYVKTSVAVPMAQTRGPYGFSVTISTRDYNTAADPSRSALRLFEQWDDGRIKELKMSRSLAAVDGLGNGRFNVMQNSPGTKPTLYFSASDGSSPRKNDRKYFYVAADSGPAAAPNPLARTVIQPLAVSADTTMKVNSRAYLDFDDIPAGADSAGKSRASKLRLFEVGASGKIVELTGAHAMHADIRKQGKGLFSHWKGDTGNRLYFSSSDNSDPRSNGRSYVAVYTVAATDNRTFVNARKTRQKTILAPAKPRDRVIEITNESRQTMTGFQIAINGVKFFQSVDDVLKTISKMKPAYKGEPLFQKIFRFVSDNIQYSVPLTPLHWQHEPQLMINSIGYGLCDDSANTFFYLATAAGYDCRIWKLNHHIVPEVFNPSTGRWEMYDPCFHVYFTKSNGQVAGVEELAANHNLILRPNDRMPTNPDLVSPYGDVYANTYVNPSVAYRSDAPIGTAQNVTFSLPAGGKLAIGYQGVLPTARYAGVKRQTLDPTVSIEIPAKNTFTLSPYLALAGFRGKGRVIIDGATYVIGSPELKRLVKGNSKYYSSITVVAGSGAATVDYWINANRFDLEMQNTANSNFVTLTSASGSVANIGKLRVDWGSV